MLNYTNRKKKINSIYHLIHLLNLGTLTTTTSHRCTLAIMDCICLQPPSYPQNSSASASWLLSSQLALYFFLCSLSSALYFSASWTIFSISSFDSLPLSFVIVIFFLCPVVLSSAETFKMPLASMSKRAVI